MQYDEAFVTLMQSIIFNHIVYLWVWIKQTLAYSKHDVINDVFNRLLIEIIWGIKKCLLISNDYIALQKKDCNDATNSFGKKHNNNNIIHI